MSALTDSVVSFESVVCGPPFVGGLSSGPVSAAAAATAAAGAASAAQTRRQRKKRTGELRKERRMGTGSSIRSAPASTSGLANETSPCHSARMRRKPLLVVGLAASLLVSARARAGITITSQRGTSPTTIYVEGERMRIDTPEKNERATAIVFDGPTKRF